MEVDIKNVTLNDVEALQAISKQTFLETFSAQNTEDNMAKYLTDSFSIEKLTAELTDKNSLFYFATLNQQPIGYLKIVFPDLATERKEEKGFELQRIYVLNEFHGKKVGQLLYQKVVDIARQQHYHYIWLGVWEKNLRAIRFYEKNGFVISGKHIFMLGDDAQTDFVMKLSLA